MSVAIFGILTVIAAISGLWLVVRIWQSSPVGAVLTFLTGLPAWYFLYKYWNDEEKDIRVPFFVNLVIVLVYFVAALNNIEVFMDTDRDEEIASAEVARSKSNPEMERWCREKHDAVYDHVLGTCVEPDPDQKLADSSRAEDVMEQLSQHFSANGLKASLSRVDASTPGARKLADMPGMNRWMQFEILSQSVMPTIVMVGECASEDECMRIEKNLNQPDSPLSSARNGNLMFLGFHVMGDAGKIARAKEAFQGFKAAF